MPARTLAELAKRPDVRSIDTAPVSTPQGLVDSTNAIGAPSFWAAGYEGGSGSADPSPINLAIERDKIQEDHPAFAGTLFQRPPGVGTGTPCGSGPGSCDHGTGVASLAISRGASGCAMCVASDANELGVAPGLHSVLDADTNGGNPPAHFDVFTWELGLPSGGAAGASYPASVFSDSHGVTNITVDDDANSRADDATLSEYGGVRTEPAGNDGPASEALDDSCIAYDVICMGAFSMGASATDPSDDTLADFSSRGPTIGGRKKPDLVGVGNPMYADRRWWIDNMLWDGRLTGTSFASPQAAGAAALLAGSGITDPLADKAILIDSARPGRSTPASPMGTQTRWQPDWGWGELDLTQALAERTHFATDTVPSYSSRFFRATVAGPGDRATLVWNRRGTECLTTGCQASVLTLTNLDLQQLDPATGAVQAQSSSSIDNVEQVRSPSSGSVIYKVRATSNVDAIAAEPFALAATNQLTPLATPQPTINLQVSKSDLRPGETATVTATAHNPSGDLTAENARLSLNLPAGIEIVAGDPAQDLGTLATSGGPGDTATATWTVKAITDTAVPITVTATATRYGETFSSSAESNVLVDGTPPSPAIAVPAASSGTGIPVTWGATDAGAGVDRYDVDVARDGGPYAAWLTATTTTSATYTGARGHLYRFRARATDRFGNASDYAESELLSLADPPSDGSWSGSSGSQGRGSGSVALAKPGLHLKRVRRSASRLAVVGTIARNARSKLRLTYVVRVGHKVIRSRATATPTRGRFKALLKIPVRARGRKRGTLMLSYPRDAAFAAEVVRMAVVSRR